MEEKIGNIILSASNLPGYKIHPYETYARLKIFGIDSVEHPRDLFKKDVGLLTQAAKSFVQKHSIKLGAIGFGTGVTGGPWGMAAGVTVDVEEYLRRVFLIAQEIGHVYGVIPIPYVENINEDVNEYFAEVQTEILKAIMIGLGVGGVSMGITEVAKSIAKKEAKEIYEKKIAHKTITKLALIIANILRRKWTKQQINKGVARAIPIVGGFANAAFCYTSVKFIGKNLIQHFEKEHNDVKKNVLNYWQNKS